MRSQVVLLTQEECHTGVYNFYKVLANRLDFPIDDYTQFDGSKVDVTEDVRNEIYKKMDEDNVSEQDKTLIWLNYGPNSNIHILKCYDEPFFAARVEHGFVMSICDE